MSTSGAEQTQQQEELGWELRRMAGETVLFHHAIADRVGLHATDLRCLDLLLNHSSLTAGRLAELTGMSTSSITTVIDRLERAGYARRRQDPKDRRRVIVEPIIDVALQKIAPLFDLMQASIEELYSHYTSEQLALITDFVRRSTEITQTEREKLRASRGGE